METKGGGSLEKFKNYRTTGLGRLYNFVTCGMKLLLSLNKTVVEDHLLSAVWNYSLLNIVVTHISGGCPRRPQTESAPYRGTLNLTRGSDTALRTWLLITELLNSFLLSWNSKFQYLNRSGPAHISKPCFWKMCFNIIFTSTLMFPRCFFMIFIFNSFRFGITRFLDFV